MVTHPRWYAGNLTGLSVRSPPSAVLSLSAPRCSRVTPGTSAAHGLHLNELWLPLTSLSYPFAHSAQYIPARARAQSHTHCGSSKDFYRSEVLQTEVLLLYCGSSRGRMGQTAVPSHMFSMTAPGGFSGGMYQSATVRAGATGHLKVSKIIPGIFHCDVCFTCAM